MDPIKIKVIIGSTRPGRFSEKPAHWIFEEAKKLPDAQVELLDLRDYPMPFFEEKVVPSVKKEPYANSVVEQWTAKIGDGDAFIIVTPEYNRGPAAVMKNALDYVNKEWNRKPVGFVSWGSTLGARAVEQLRMNAIEVQMAPIRQAIHIPSAIYMEGRGQSTVDPTLFEPLAPTKDMFLDQLMWWAKALKVARINP